MSLPFVVDPPDFPELREERLDDVDADELLLSGARVDCEGRPAVSSAVVRIDESELVGVAFRGAAIRNFRLADVALIECDLSNLDGRFASIVRTRVTRSRLVGFSITEGEIRDLRVEDSTMMLGSFAYSKLRSVAFERVNLREASFLETALDSVAFIDCELTGADFRQARLRRCLIRGSSLEDVTGVGSLRGLSMPWPDIVASAGALASELGITIESDGGSADE